MSKTETPNHARGAKAETAQGDKRADARGRGVPAGTVDSVEITGVHPAGRLTYHAEPGVNIITGENGTGKSVLLKAMWHALTGRWTGTGRTPGGVPMARMVRPYPAGAAGRIAAVRGRRGAAPIEGDANRRGTLREAPTHRTPVGYTEHGAGPSERAATGRMNEAKETADAGNPGRGRRTDEQNDEARPDGVVRARTGTIDRTQTN